MYALLHYSIYANLPYLPLFFFHRSTILIFQPPSSIGDEPDMDRPQSLKISPDVPPGPPVLKVRKSSLDKGKKKKKPTVSSQYLYGLLGACILVRLYLQLGLILKLLPIPVVFYLGKKFAIQLGLVDKVRMLHQNFGMELALQVLLFWLLRLPMWN